MPALQNKGSTWLVSDIEELEAQAWASNQSAAGTYGSAFRRVQDRPDGLQDLDLLSIRISDIDVPILQNGTNGYRERSSKVVRLSAEFAAREIVKPHCHIVIPEAANVASPLIPDWVATIALDSILSSFAGNPGHFRVAQPDHMSLQTALRFFDSHLSIAFYWDVCLRLLRDHQWRTDISGLTCCLKDYKGDLASRFSDASARSLFVSNLYFHAESIRDAKKRRTFINPKAPNQERLLLIGDSHSFSAMTHILSHYFREVHFFWANRINCYGAWKEDIIEVARNADFIVEESAERFFLKNFTVPA